MALARWNGVVQDAEGNAVSGAQIEVRSEQTGRLVPLFADREGLTRLGNPFTAPEATAAFHAGGDSYRITASKGGLLSEWRYVALGTTAEYDVDGLLEAAQIPTFTALVGATVARMDAVEAGQGEGIIGATTKAALDALAVTLGLGPSNVGAIGKVFNDPDRTRNGEYSWTGAAWKFENAGKPAAVLIEGVSIGNEDGASIPSGEYQATAYATLAVPYDKLYAQITSGDGALDLSVLRNGVTVFGPITLRAGVPLTLDNLAIAVTVGDSIAFMIEAVDQVYGLWAQISGEL